MMLLARITKKIQNKIAKLSLRILPGPKALSELPRRHRTGPVHGQGRYRLYVRDELRANETRIKR